MYLCTHKIKRNTMYTEAELKTVAPERIDIMVDDVETVPYADMNREVYTPEEAYELIMSDIKSIYGVNDAV